MDNGSDSSVIEKEKKIGCKMNPVKECESARTVFGSKMTASTALPLVCGTILKLHDAQGSSFDQIMHYLTNERILGENHAGIVKKALKKAVDDHLLSVGPEGNYRLVFDDVRTVNKIVLSCCKNNCGKPSRQLPMEEDQRHGKEQYQVEDGVPFCVNCAKRKGCRKKKASKRKKTAKKCGPCGRKKRTSTKRRKRRPCTRMWVPPKRKIKQRRNQKKYDKDSGQEEEYHECCPDHHRCHSSDDYNSESGGEYNGEGGCPHTLYLCRRHRNETH